MSATTTDLSTLPREVWVQKEGRSKMRLFIESDAKIIEDLKQQVFGDSRDEYHAFYLQQHLQEQYLIPIDVSPEKPIQFKRINGRRSLQSKDYLGMGLQLETNDERETRAILSNIKTVAKVNTCMNKWQSNCT